MYIAKLNETQMECVSLLIMLIYGTIYCNVYMLYLEDVFVYNCDLLIFLCPIEGDTMDILQVLHTVYHQLLQNFSCHPLVKNVKKSLLNL